MTDVFDSLSRGPEGQSLVAFIRQNGLVGLHPDDWPSAVKAMVSGQQLGSQNGQSVVLNGGQLNNEFLIHLIGQNDRCVANLSIIIAMAAAYCVERQDRAQSLIDAIGSRHRPTATKPKKLKSRKK